jgi:hypothetical protein
MDDQFAGRQTTDISQIAHWVAWAILHVIIALQILAFGDKLHVNPFALMLAFLIGLSVIVGTDVYQRRKTSRHSGGSVRDEGKGPQIDIWRSEQGQIAATILAVFAAVAMFAKPFGGGIDFGIAKILVLGVVVIIGLSGILTRHRQHGRYGPLVWSVLGTTFYSVALICVFERDAFVHLPLMFQSNLPTVLEFTYVTLAFVTAGAVATITSRTWEARLRKQT